MGMSLAVLGATLSIFSGSERIDRQTQARNASQESARLAMDLMSRELRNLASPTPEQPEAVDLAGPYDLVFETVDPVGPNLADNGSDVESARFFLGGPAALGGLFRQGARGAPAAPPPPPAAA